MPAPTHLTAVATSPDDRHRELGRASQLFGEGAEDPPRSGDREEAGFLVLADLEHAPGRRLRADPEPGVRSSSIGSDGQRFGPPAGTAER